MSRPVLTFSGDSMRDIFSYGSVTLEAITFIPQIPFRLEEVGRPRVGDEYEGGSS